MFLDNEEDGTTSYNQGKELLADNSVKETAIWDSYHKLRCMCQAEIIFPHLTAGAPHALDFAQVKINQRRAECCSSIRISMKEAPI